MQCSYDWEIRKNLDMLEGRSRKQSCKTTAHTFLSRLIMCMSACWASIRRKKPKDPKLRPQHSDLQFQQNFYTQHRPLHNRTLSQGANAPELSEKAKTNFYENVHLDEHAEDYFSSPSVLITQVLVTPVSCLKEQLRSSSRPVTPAAVKEQQQQQQQQQLDVSRMTMHSKGSLTKSIRSRCSSSTTDDPDAIEVCNEPESVRFGARRKPATLYSRPDYSYAYYVRGDADSDILPPLELPEHQRQYYHMQPPPRNSIRALLSQRKGRTVLPPRNGYEYGTALSRKQALDLTEHCYEEIREDKTKPLMPMLRGAEYISKEEELLRVQSRHRRVLAELNLSVEELLMAESMTDVRCGGSQEAEMKLQTTVTNYPAYCHR